MLRKRSGDEVDIFDSSGRAFRAVLDVGGDGVRAVLRSESAAPRPPGIEIALAQGIPKGAKMDFVIEKATELGIARIIPFVSERTQGGGDRAGKVARWRRLAMAAAQQCGRADVPAVDEPLEWERLCATMATFDRALVPWELAPGEPLRDRLPAAVAGARRVLIAIGPEGGLSHGEVESAIASGAVPLSLGARILRTETAGLVACAALLYASGDL